MVQQFRPNDKQDNSWTDGGAWKNLRKEARQAKMQAKDGNASKKRPAEARQLKCYDVDFFDGPQSTRYERVYGIVHIKEPKTCRMTRHATQQHVLVECLAICQLI